jgi:hypothetical protein
VDRGAAFTLKMLEDFSRSRRDDSLLVDTTTWGGAQPVSPIMTTSRKTLSARS